IFRSEVVNVTGTSDKGSSAWTRFAGTMALTAPQSGMATLTWAVNFESCLAGYKAYLETSTESQLSAIDVGNATTHTVVGRLPGAGAITSRSRPIRGGRSAATRMRPATTAVNSPHELSSAVHDC